MAEKFIFSSYVVAIKYRVSHALECLNNTLSFISLSLCITAMLLVRERGDNGLFIALVPKVLYKIFYLLAK